MYGPEKFALNVNKEIMNFSYLKALFIFSFSFFLFIYSFVIPLCTWALCLVSSTILGIIFYIYCFIVSFIISACKEPWYIYIKNIVILHAKKTMNFWNPFLFFFLFFFPSLFLVFLIVFFSFSSFFFPFSSVLFYYALFFCFSWFYALHKFP